ncbi:MAG: peptidase, partial [Ignavibacteriaceae bacterium]|nr:peptidase [Ignavibacteriaceae bacterium]
MKYLSITILFISIFLLGCEKKTENKDAEDIAMLKEKIAKFVPTELDYDSSTLDEREKVVVEKLYLASKIMDEIFLEQVYSKNDEIKAQLLKENTEVSKLQ